jgi:hypothetical protein
MVNTKTTTRQIQSADIVASVAKTHRTSSLRQISLHLGEVLFALLAGLLWHDLAGDGIGAEGAPEKEDVRFGAAKKDDSAPIRTIHRITRIYFILTAKKRSTGGGRSAPSRGSAGRRCRATPARSEDELLGGSERSLSGE